MQRLNIFKIYSRSRLYKFSNHFVRPIIEPELLPYNNAPASILKKEKRPRRYSSVGIFADNLIKNPQGVHGFDTWPML